MPVLSQHFSEKPLKPFSYNLKRKKVGGVEESMGSWWLSKPSAVYLPADVAACAGGQCFVVNWLLYVEEAVADWSLWNICIHSSAVRVSGQKTAGDCFTNSPWGVSITCCPRMQRSAIDYVNCGWQRDRHRASSFAPYYIEEDTYYVIMWLLRRTKSSTALWGSKRRKDPTIYQTVIIPTKQRQPTIDCHAEHGPAIRRHRKKIITFYLFFLSALFQEAPRTREKPIPLIRFPKFTAPVAKQAGGVWRLDSPAGVRFMLTPPPERAGTPRHTTEALPSPSPPLYSLSFFGERPYCAPLASPVFRRWKGPLPPSPTGHSALRGLQPRTIDKFAISLMVRRVRERRSASGATDCWMTTAMNVVICQPW